MKNKLVKTPSGYRVHPTRWMVKQISGENKGAYTTHEYEAQARMEALYMHDNFGIVTSIVPPLYSDQ